MDIVNAIEDEKDHVYPMPESKKDGQGNPIPVDTNTIEGLIIKSQVTQYMQDVKQYDIEKVNAHALFYGQCHKSVKDKLEQRTDWEDIKKDILKLVKAIKEITHNYQETKYPFEPIYYAWKKILNIKQEEKESLVDYTKRFRIARDILETQYGQPTYPKYVWNVPGYAGMTQDQRVSEIDKANERFMAYAYVQGVHNTKGGLLVEQMSNDYAIRRNNEAYT